MAEEEFPTIVIDHGSLTCRFGFYGDDAPRVVPTVVGRDKSGENLKDFYVGEEAWSKRMELRLKYPIENGVVCNWTDMEAIWHHIFYNELKVEPQKHNMLLTEPPMNPAANRERMTEIMFETFETPLFTVVSHPVLSLFNSGCTTGIVVDSGDGASHAVPIYEGFLLAHAATGSYRLFAGRDVTEYLTQMLAELGYSFTPHERELVVDIKKKLCYIALDYDAEMAAATGSSDMEKIFTLPDGKIITLGDQRFRCPEVLFQPGLKDRDAPSFQDATFQSISKCDVEIQKDMYKNVVLSGGNTMFAGFSERMTKELTALAPPDTEVKVVTPCKDSAWRAGQSLAYPGLGQSKDWISKSEYWETGPTIVQKKCPV